MNRLVRNRPSCRETRRQSWQGRSGFTLTELLVTMAIMALLLGLLFPCIRLVQAWGREVEQGTLFREVALAMLQYAQDHEGSFPEVTNLAEADQQVGKALESYLKDKKLISTLDAIGWRYGPYPERSLNSVKLDQILNPGRVPIGGERFSDLRGKGKVWVIFADGHVERMTKEEVSEVLRPPIPRAGRTTDGFTRDPNSGPIHIQL